jgi:hypothetical protein
MGRRNFLEREFASSVTTAPSHDRHEARGSLHLPARTVVFWNQLSLGALHALPDALPAGPALALLHTAMYNAWAAYDDDARQTETGVAVRLPRAQRSAASKARAMHYAAWHTLGALMPARQVELDLQMASLNVNPAREDGPLTPVGIGRVQAAALLERRTVVDTAGGANKAHLANDAQAAAWTAPADLPCHWYRLARYVSERDGHDDDQDVLLYVVLTNALVDAIEAARACDGRPRFAQGACAAAAADVLRSFTGSDRLGPGSSPGRCGGPVFEPSWTTFTEAAERTCIDAAVGAAAGNDAGVLADYAAGMALGRQIGALAFDAARRAWQG